MKPLIFVIVMVAFFSVSVPAVYASDQVIIDQIDTSRFAFTGQTVKDKRTGLTWMRDANMGKLDWQGTLGLIKRLNAIKYAGFGDWRLPSDELATLQDYAKGVGCDESSKSGVNYGLTYIHLNRIGFYDVQGDYYWSSHIPDDPNFAKAVHMYYSRNSYDESAANKKKDKFHVWLVRGGN